MTTVTFDDVDAPEAPARRYAEKPPGKYRYRYRLCVGPHVDSVRLYDEDGKPAKDANGLPALRERYFHALGKSAPEHCQPNEGSVIHTDQYLDRHNTPGYRPKFERIHDDPALTGKITAEELAVRGLTPDVLDQLRLAWAAKPPESQSGKADGATPPTAQHVPDLDGMSYKQLQEYAAAEEVPGYDAARGKAELVSLIRKSSGAKVGSHG